MSEDLPPLPGGWRYGPLTEAGGRWRCQIEHHECGELVGYGATREAAISDAVRELATGDETF